MQGERSVIGSATCDSTVDPQRYWNNMRDPSEEQLSDCVILSSNANIAYQNSPLHEEYGSNGWSLGESSLSGAHGRVNLNDSYQNSQPCEGIVLSGWSLGESSSSGAHNQVDQNENQQAENLTNLESTGRDDDDEDDEDDDCQVIECIDSFKLGSSSSSSHPFDTSTGIGGFIVEDSDERPSSLLDSNRLSCKRKILEASAGQSSRSGSSSHLHHTGTSVPVPTENSRLGLRVGGPASDVPLTLSSTGTVETSLRNFRLRINNSYPGVESSTQDVRENTNMASVQRMLRLPPISNSLDLSPFTVSDNSAHQRPTIGSLRRNSLSGTGSSSSESSPTDISQHPMLISANSFQSSGNGNVASSSGIGSSSGLNLPAPSLVLQNSTHYPRSSLMPPPGAETGTPDLALPSGSSSHGHRRLHSRSAALLLERHLGSTFGIPYSSRSSAASGEGRSRLVSEIRNVLDLMRRGEGLRPEDVMILDQSVFFEMANIHDRHRDMRLDVDNMSYEELLALGERIGNVSTGLSEETISSQLKQRKYMCINTEDDGEAAEPCSICQEEYKDGEDLGLLDCGHDYHTECIKKWLSNKNSCPICKTTGLNK